MELETKRLVIRPSTFADYPGYYEIYRDYETASLSGVTPMNDVFDAEKLLVRLIMDNRVTVYSVFAKENGLLVGTVSASGVDRGSGLELGYAVCKTYRRRGIAYEAMSELMKYYKDHYGYRYFQAVIKKENIPSQNLIRKLGFVYLGKYANVSGDRLFRK